MRESVLFLLLTRVVSFTLQFLPELLQHLAHGLHDDSMVLPAQHIK